jgi:PAS domain S-box-containing protein
VSAQYRLKGFRREFAEKYQTAIETRIIQTAFRQRPQALVVGWWTMEANLIKANNGKPDPKVSQGKSGDNWRGDPIPHVDWSQRNQFEHFVQFYETDPFLLDSVSGFVTAGLGPGEAVIVVATNEHRAGLEERLRGTETDLVTAAASGQYLSWDAAETLSKFMVEGLPDAERFADVLGDVIARASGGGRRVRIFGEMVRLLWEEGNYTGAIQLEELWNKLRHMNPFMLFCAYRVNGFGREALAASLSNVCDEHSHIIPAESYTWLPTSEDRLRLVVQLQQKAHGLRQEIAERRETEARLRASEISYRRLFETSTDGILILKPGTGQIADANPSATQLLGWRHDELLNKELWEIGLLKDREANLEAIRELHEKRFIRYERLPLQTGDGHYRDVEFTCNIFEANSHQVIQCNLRDITERDWSEISSHLAAIVESSDDAIISKSLEGRILSWNKGAERIFGYSAEEVIGKPIQILIPPARIDEEPRILEKLKRGESLDHFETVRLTKDGRALDISVTVSPIRDRSGKVIAASKIARDISDRKRIESEREQLLARERAARAEAETANRTKDEFLATVSHELRTPLNAIIGWSHMLRGGKLDEANVGRALETIQRNAKAQAQLIEDILDVSRVVTGKLRLRRGSVNLASVINAAVDSVQLAADSKRIQLVVTLDTSARHISGDSSRLQQVVWNLLSNAIKFTPSEGRIEVRLKRIAPDVQIEVRDTGEGIRSDFLPFVFDRFAQGDASTTRSQGGLGLGLAIVRHLVELHGGTVHADSPGEGCGATFIIRLPLGVAHKPGKRQKRNTEGHEDTNAQVAPLPSLEGVQVLLVDDDPDSLNIVTEMLADCRAKVLAVASATEALEALRCHQPDVLVSDLAMPNEDGHSLLGKVRAWEAETGKRIPALALTAYVTVEDRMRALSAGFNMFVPKPFEPNELISAIANLAGLSVKPPAI